MAQGRRLNSRAWIGALCVASFAACNAPGKPATTTVADSTLRAPDNTLVPAGRLGASIRRGRAILMATRDSLPGHVGSALRCTSCHLHEGRDTLALPLTGVYARFPQYRARTDAVQRLEDRINDCFIRSLNGSALAPDDRAMTDIVAYLAFISRGIVVGPAADQHPALAVAGDTVAGAIAYRQQCARCHGEAGAGQTAFPPLWGDGSFNIGAGMARAGTATLFIRKNMPFDRPGTLTDQEARDVASYVTSRPRPDLPGKERDWPAGNPPADLPYHTDGPGRTP